MMQEKAIIYLKTTRHFLRYIRFIFLIMHIYDFFIFV
jgi:hypothetical protein